MSNDQNPSPESSNTPAEAIVSEETSNESVESQETQEDGDVVTPEVQDLSKKEQKQLAQELKKKFKIKVNGKEYEEELDLNNDEDIVRRLQMNKLSQQRVQEAQELKKAAEQFIEMLRTNPRKVLADPNIGVDLKKLAQDVINEEIENSTKSPEQIEKERLQRELEELREKYKKDEDERKNREFQRLQAEQEEKIQSDIEGALTTSDLPKTPYTVRKMAEMMMLALQNDIDLSPKDLVPMLRKQMQADIKELFSASTDDVLEEFIGKDRISSIRKKQVAKVKQQVAETANQVKPTGNDVKKAETKDQKKITIKEFLRS